MAALISGENFLKIQKKKKLGRPDSLSLIWRHYGSPNPPRDRIALSAVLEHIDLLALSDCSHLLTPNGLNWKSPNCSLQSILEKE